MSLASPRPWGMYRLMEGSRYLLLPVPLLEAEGCCVGYVRWRRQILATRSPDVKSFFQRGPFTSCYLQVIKRLQDTCFLAVMPNFTA